MNRSTRNLYIIGGLTLTVFFILILWQVPQWQSRAYLAKFSPELLQELKPPERVQLERNAADIENSTRLTIAQIIGGLALLSGLYFTYQNVKTAQDNLRVTEEGKLTERFSKAVELLGSEKLDIRLGGIYALERIARDSPKDHWTVMEVLTAFVRENSPKKLDKPEKPVSRKYLSPESETEKIIGKLREDIQVIMTVIGRRKWMESEYSKRLDLQNVNLAGFSLTKVNLSRADLSRADLSRADLSSADLSFADLSFADLSNADLSFADLRSADLSFANLSFANLSEGYLSEANLVRADLNFADLSYANLRGADLSFADLASNQFITLHQLTSAKRIQNILLPSVLKAEFNEWQSNRTKKIIENGKDSGEKAAEE